MLHNESHIAFLRYLLQQGTPVTAKNISAKLGVRFEPLRITPPLSTMPHHLEWCSPAHLAIMSSEVAP